MSEQRIPVEVVLERLDFMAVSELSAIMRETAEAAAAIIRANGMAPSQVPSKQDALRALALIEDIWELAPELPYTRVLRDFINATDVKVRDEAKRPTMSMFATAADYNAAMDEWIASGKESLQ